MGEDETNVPESRKGTCKKQIRDGAGGLLWNLNEYWGDIGQQCSAAQCCRRVYEHDGLAPVEFLKDRLIIRMSQPLLVLIGRQSDAVRFEYAIGVLDFAQAGLGIWKGYYGKQTAADPDLSLLKMAQTENQKLKD